MLEKLTCDVFRMEWNAMKLLALTAYCGWPSAVSPSSRVRRRQSRYAARPATGHTSPGLSSTNHLQTQPFILSRILKILLFCVAQIIAKFCYGSWQELGNIEKVDECSSLKKMMQSLCKCLVENILPQGTSPVVNIFRSMVALFTFAFSP